MTDPLHGELQPLRTRDQWVTVERRRDLLDPAGELNKTPINARTGDNASVTDPTTWCPFAVCARLVAEGRYTALGYCVTLADGLVFVDIDDCIDPVSGELRAEALEIVLMLHTYTEISISGTGLHLIGRGSIERNLGKAFYRGLKIELYTHGRYFVLTGNRWPDTPPDIEDMSGAIDELYARIRPPIRRSNGAQPADESANGYRGDDRWKAHVLVRAVAKMRGARPPVFDETGKKITSGELHHTRYSMGRLLGGLGGYISEDDAVQLLLEAQPPRNNHAQEEQTIRDGYRVGQRALLTPGLEIIGPESALDRVYALASACTWFQQSLAWLHYWSPRSYPAYGIGVALWILSVVAARRISLPAGMGKERFTQLVIMLVGATSISAKTTVAEAGSAILQEAGLWRLLFSGDMTAEAWAQDGAGKLPKDYGQLSGRQQDAVRHRIAFAGQRSVYLEEAGSRIRALLNDNSPWSRWRDVWKRLDDAPASYEYRTRGGGHDTVERPYMATLMTTTPGDLIRVGRAHSPLWLDGFFARALLLTPPTAFVRSAALFPSGERTIPESITAPLQQLHQRLGVPVVQVAAVDSDDPKSAYEITGIVSAPGIACRFAPGVRDQYARYDAEMQRLLDDGAPTDVHGSLARHAEKTVRIAMLLAAIETDGLITEDIWALAEAIGDVFIDSLRGAYGALQGDGLDREAKQEARVYLVIRERGPISVRDIARYAPLATATVNSIVAALGESGAIVAHPRAGKAPLYAVAGPDTSQPSTAPLVWDASAPARP